MAEFSEETKKRNGEWQHFVEHCLDLYERFKKSEWREKKIERIKEAYRVYAQEGKNTNFPWENASNTELPLFTITVDNLEPRLVASLTGKKPIVQFDMDGIAEQDEITKILEDWFNDELDQTVKIQDVAGFSVHKTLLEGIVYPIVRYEEDEVVRRQFQFDEQGRIVVDPETGEPLVVDEVESIFQGARVEFAEFTDVFTPDPTEIDDWEKTDVIQVVRPTYGELMQNKDRPGYMNIGPWLLKEESDAGEKSEEEMSPQEQVMDSRVRANETIECLQCVVYYVYREEGESKEDVENWQPSRMVGLIAKESQTLIRLLPLIELNFQNEHLLKRLQLYPDGASLYDKMLSIQNGATDLFNTVVNVANVTMVPWFMYSAAAGFRGEQKIEPGKGIEVDDVTQVSFPKFSQNPRSYIVFIEMFMSLWEKLGSIGDIQVGQISEGSKDVTATETMAAIQEGNIKHNYHGLALKKDFIQVLRTVFDLYYQKMPYGARFNYHGRMIEIPRAYMRRRYKFKLTGSSDLSNKVLEMKKNQSLYQMIGGDPMVNRLPMIEDLVEAHKDGADPKKYINPTINQILQAMQQAPELPQVIQQYMQQKAQQQRQGAAAQQMNMAEATGNQMAQSLMEAFNQAPGGGQQ
jgi:hypothetical protein